MDLKLLQKQLENTHNKNLLMKRVFTEIKSDEDLMKFIKDSEVNEKLAVKTLAMLAIYKRLNIEVLIAMLYKPTGKLSLSEIASAVEDMEKKNFFKFDAERSQCLVRFELDDQTYVELGAFQYPLPLVVTPKLLKHNMSSAYYQKRKQSVLLHGRETTKDVDLEHLNLMNQIPFQINTTVLKKAVNIWKPKDDGEEDMTQAQLDRFNKYCGISQKIITEHGNKFYFSHRYDYRGRTYNEGYYEHYQGNDYCKSLIEFANKEIIPD